MSNLTMFNSLVDVNEDAIRNEMRWENYDLNETVVAVTEQIKNDAINVLKRSYGRCIVEPDILDDLLNDVFIYFPSLLQQLAITRLIDSIGVVKDDVNRTTLTRNENLLNETEQNNTNSTTLNGSDTTTLNTQNATAATSNDSSTNSNTQTSTTEIENTSGVEATGARNVNLTHSMPEHSMIDGELPTDQQGTPILSTTFLQEASEGFSTSNPINSTETSLQTIENTDSTTVENESESNTTTTNTGTTNNVNQSVANDTGESTTTSTGTNVITETVESTTTNKQYAYEIKAFLETANSINAFNIWADRFNWIEGII